VNRTLPLRLPNAAYRQREYLTEKEVERLIEAARKRGRNNARDSAAILLAYRHGLRAQELCQLRWAQVDLANGRLHVNRAKGGIESVHPLHGPELRALRPLQGKSPYVFTTEAGTPVTPSCFLRMVQRTGKAAKLPFAVHPHMLRHSTGFKLDTIRDHSRTTSAIATCRAQHATQHWPKTGLHNSGRTNAKAGPPGECNFQPFSGPSPSIPMRR
jgi:integrase